MLRISRRQAVACAVAILAAALPATASADKQSRPQRSLTHHFAFAIWKAGSSEAAVRKFGNIPPDVKLVPCPDREPFGRELPAGRADVGLVTAEATYIDPPFNGERIKMLMIATCARVPGVQYPVGSPEPPIFFLRMYSSSPRLNQTLERYAIDGRDADVTYTDIGDPRLATWTFEARNEGGLVASSAFSSPFGSDLHLLNHDSTPSPCTVPRRWTGLAVSIDSESQAVGTQEVDFPWMYVCYGSPTSMRWDETSPMWELLGPPYPPTLAGQEFPIDHDGDGADAISRWALN